jgi:hypothetical protein
VTQDELSQPPKMQHLSPSKTHQREPSEEEDDDHGGDDPEGYMYNNGIGDLDAYCMQEDMENDIMKHVL